MPEEEDDDDIVDAGAIDDLEGRPPLLPGLLLPPPSISTELLLALVESREKGIGIDAATGATYRTEELGLWAQDLLCSWQAVH